MEEKSQSTTESPYNLLKKGFSKVDHYYVDDKGNTVYYYTKKKRVDEDDDKPKIRVIMNGRIAIKEKLYNERTKTHSYVLIGEDNSGKKFEILVSRDEFAKHQKLYAKISSYFGIRTCYDFKKMDTLDNIIRSTTANNYIKELTEVDQIIWAGNKLIVPSIEPEDYRCMVNKTKYPYNMSDDSMLCVGMKALDYIIKSCPDRSLIMPLLILTFISPIVGKYFPDNRYGYFLSGETGSLKTTTVRILLQIYGAGFKGTDSMMKLGKEGSTVNAAMSLAAQAGVMPTLFDNFKPIEGVKGKTKADLVGLIHTIMEGSDKDRLTAEGEDRDNKTFYTCPMFTGEDYFVEASSSARVPPLQWVTPNKKIYDEATLEMRKHLSAIGRVWLEWLQSEDGLKAMAVMVDEYESKRTQMQHLFEVNKDTNPARLGSNMALQTLGWELMLKHPILGEYFKQYNGEMANITTDNIIMMGEATSKGTEVNQVVELLKEGLASGALWAGEGGDYDMSGPKQIVIGWNDGVHVYIYPKILEEYVNKHSENVQKLSSTGIGRQLMSHELIVPYTDPNTRKQRPSTPKWQPGRRSTVAVYVFPIASLFDTSMAPKNPWENCRVNVEDLGKKAQTA